MSCILQFNIDRRDIYTWKQVLQRKIKYESIERMYLCTIIFNYPTGWGTVKTLQDQVVTDILVKLENMLPGCYSYYILYINLLTLGYVHR